MSGGVLVLAATPIGDPRDAAPRLADELRLADVVAAEDTRRLRRLCQDLDVNPTGRVLSFHEHNEAERTPELVERLREGARVARRDGCRDAVRLRPRLPPRERRGRHRRPGHRRAGAVRGAHGAGRVRACPSTGSASRGSSRVGRGSGRSPSRALAAEPRTMVFFEAPHRLARTLAAMAEAFGADRRAAVCRELTKTYEEVRRGSLDRAASPGPPTGCAARSPSSSPGPPGRSPTSTASSRASASGSPRASGSRTSAPTSPRRPACRRRRCTTPW